MVGSEDGANAAALAERDEVRDEGAGANEEEDGVGEEEDMKDVLASPDEDESPVAAGGATRALVLNDQQLAAIVLLAF